MGEITKTWPLKRTALIRKPIGRKCASLEAALEWATDLVGNHSPNNTYWVVDEIKQFQVVERDGGQYLILLVELSFLEMAEGG